MSSTRHNVTPNPSRITSGLRDTGYELNTAIADIVDNSVAAKATNIQIELELDPRGRVRFSVADNGVGMSAKGLVNALTYGSEIREDLASLGKFGLGLKTASTAFARRLEVTSRNVSNETPLTFVWDLDEVEDHGWSVEELNEANPLDVQLLDSISGGGSGTVIRWQKVDRVFEREYQAPTGTHAVNAVKKKVDALRAHLSMVFQRFLDENDDRSPNVTMVLNGEKIVPWDPFAWGSQILLNNELAVEGESGEIASMSIKAVVLPRKAELIEAFGEIGPKSARLENDYQGIYIYRENRMIHGPDWLGLWMKEPHFTLSRVEISFDHKLDEAFKVDIKKSRIILNDAIIRAVREMLNPPRKEAENRYRAGKRVIVSSMATPSIHATSNAAISDVASSINSPKLESVDKEHGEALIENGYGSVKVKYVDNPDKGIFLEAVDDLPHGVFYEPAYIGSNPGVRISKSHPYYEKVYLPNRNDGNTIQALDSLLWALASAEFRSTQDSTRQVFEDIRFDVSRALGRLVQDLPDAPEIDV